MTGCVHKVKWSVKRPEDCRFRLSVSHYKDRIVAPDEYTGATEVTPSDQTQVLETKDKLVREDITINPAPAPDLRPLTIDSLTQSGTFLPTGDGFSQVTVEEEWDGILYPVTDESDTLYSQKVFSAHHVRLSAGDVLIVDCYGRGTYFGFRKVESKKQVENLPTRTAFVVMPSPYFTYLTFKWEIPEDCIIVLAGDSGSNEGTHSGQVGYCFCGDYMRWKIIHAT